MTNKPKPRDIDLVRSTYRPSKKELENTEAMLDFPEGTTVNDVLQAVFQPVNIKRKPRPWGIWPLPYIIPQN